MTCLIALALSLLADPALAGGGSSHSAGPPPLGGLETSQGQTTFYFDVEEADETDIRVFHDGVQLEVEALGRCVLPGDSEEHLCFRTVSGRRGLLTLRVDVRKQGQWQAGEEILVGLGSEGGTVVAHLPQWMVYTYGSSSTSWAVGLGGEWSLCRVGGTLPASMNCRDGHWAFPFSALVQVEVQHAEGPIRRSVVPVASGVYTFYRSGRTIRGELEPTP